QPSDLPASDFRERLIKCSRASSICGHGSSSSASLRATSASGVGHVGPTTAAAVVAFARALAAAAAALLPSAVGAAGGRRRWPFRWSTWNVSLARPQDIASQSKGLFGGALNFEKQLFGSQLLRIWKSSET
ncbi:Os02g0211100, partial [Oryza sativa Japonica Group]